MSFATAVTRLSELQAWQTRLVPAGAVSPGAPSETAFSRQLEQATKAAEAKGPYAEEIQKAGARYGVDPALIRAVIQHESGFDPNATSKAGAGGLMQLMPDTAHALGVDAYDPAQAIDGGTRYLADQLRQFGGDVRLALAAYNAGPGAVQRYHGVPPYAETQAYVQNVYATYQGFLDDTTMQGRAA